MAVTAWKYPTAEGQIDSGWVNPDRVYADDGSYCHAYPTPADPNQDFYTFGFTSSDIPVDGTVIDGFEIEVEAGMQNPSTTMRQELYMVFGAKVGTSETFDWDTTSVATHTFGGPTELFGYSTWTQAKVCNVNFGIWCTVTDLLGSPYPTCRLQIDYIKVRVYYHHEYTTTVTTKVYPSPIQTTDWYSPASNGQIDSEWFRPAYAYSSNDIRSQAVGSSALDDEQDYYNFGISAAGIPTDATITKIEVGIEAKVTAGSTVRLDTQLVKAGAKVGDVNSTEFSWTETSDTTRTSTGTLWNTTWTAAQLTASTFGVHCTAVFVAGGSGDIDIDHIKIRISYYAGGIISVARSAVVATTLNVLDTIASVARTATVVLRAKINPLPRVVNIAAAPGTPPGSEKEIGFDDGTIEKSIARNDGTEKS